MNHPIAALLKDVPRYALAKEGYLRPDTDGFWMNRTDILAALEAAEAEAATLRAEVERLRGAVLQKVAECLAGMTYREVTQEARARIKRALDAALEGKA